MKQHIILFCMLLLCCTPCDRKADVNSFRDEEKPLVALGQLWGFLKYHHPAVADGRYDWDLELVKLIPAVINAQSESDWKMILNNWIDSLPPIQKTERDTIPASRIKVKADYGELFNPEYFHPETVEKLKFILDSTQIHSNHYVKEDGKKINNEPAYEEMLFPELPYRLLALFRYWNVVNYFFPYRELCDQKWSEVLSEMLPDFINAGNQEQYMLACLKLCTKIDDSHGFFLCYERDKWNGLFKAPLEAQFIEDKLVVTGYTGDSARIQKEIQIGDVITAINGETVENIVERLLPYTPASNHAIKLRNMLRNNILRTNENTINLSILRDSLTFEKQILAYDLRRLKIPDYFHPRPDENGYSILQDSIGYVFPTNCKPGERDREVDRLLSNTKGLIIDYRCYPFDYSSTSIVFHLLKEPAFVRNSKGSITYPGYFFSVDGKIENSRNHYPYRVVVIVNEYTQSQAEDHVVRYQSAPNVTVIGSTTAAANGSVFNFLLPGDIQVSMTGVGVYYPDGGDLQRTGIRIDEVVKPTIAGIKAGRDELLERAIEIIGQDFHTISTKKN